MGRLGRSWGCPALRAAIAKPIIDVLKDGQFVFSYYPDQHWLTRSALLKCPASGLARHGVKGTTIRRNPAAASHGNSTMSPMAVIVSLTASARTPTRNGILIAVCTVPTGKKGHETPTGVFTLATRRPRRRRHDRREDAGSRLRSALGMAPSRTMGVSSPLRIRASAERQRRAGAAKKMAPEAVSSGFHPPFTKLTSKQTRPASHASYGLRQRFLTARQWILPMPFTRAAGT